MNDVAGGCLHAIVEVFGRILLELLLRTVCAVTGAILIFIFSFGQVRPPVAPFEPTATIFVSSGERNYAAEGIALLGLLFWVAVGVLIWWIVS